jgi:hypothetical protein
MSSRLGNVPEREAVPRIILTSVPLTKQRQRPEPLGIPISEETRTITQWLPPAVHTENAVVKSAPHIVHRKINDIGAVSITEIDGPVSINVDRLREGKLLHNRRLHTEH